MTIGITSDIRGFMAAMATIPAIGKYEAERMVKGIRRELVRAEGRAREDAVRTHRRRRRGMGKHGRKPTARDRRALRRERRRNPRVISIYV